MQASAEEEGMEPDGAQEKPGGVNADFAGTALEHLSLDEDTEWEHLTPEQQAAFIKAVDAGRLADVIEPWQPWWMSAGAVLEASPAAPAPPETPQSHTDAATVTESTSAEKCAFDPTAAAADAAEGHAGAGSGSGLRGKKIVIEDADDDSDASLEEEQGGTRNVAQHRRADQSGGSEAQVEGSGQGRRQEQETVEDEEGGEDGEAVSVSRVPQVPSGIPPLTSLMSKEPSPLLPFSLAGLLWCYALSQVPIS